MLTCVIGQNRLVRVVCAFVQALLRNKVMEVQDVYVEVRSFCFQFAKIKEASVLLRFLSTEKP